MPEFNAAIALAQLERLDELVNLRKETGKLFIEAMEECDYITPQFVPKGYENSYYTIGAVYNGQEKI